MLRIERSAARAWKERQRPLHGEQRAIIVVSTIDGLLPKGPSNQGMPVQALDAAGTVWGC